MKRVKPLRDQSPSTLRKLTAIRDRLELFLDRRGYDAVSIPIMDSTDLFLRKSGGELASRMYSFTDPAGRAVSLRPEFTASVAQAVIQGALKQPVPQRWQYSGPVFRYEPPSPGDSIEGDGAKEFHQLGAELIGGRGELADAEVVALAAQGLSAIGVSGHRIRIGHMGVVNSLLNELGLSERGRSLVRDGLSDIRTSTGGMQQIRERATALGLLGQPGSNEGPAPMTEEAARQMADGFLSSDKPATIGQRTPEEIYDRFLRKIREGQAPGDLESALVLASELAKIGGTWVKSRPLFLRLLKKYGIGPDLIQPLDNLDSALANFDLRGIPVVVDLSMTLGLAYYTGIVFTVEHPRIKGAPQLGGGGRYDGLFAALGGKKDIPSLGFAYSIERIGELLPRGFGEEGRAAVNRVLVVGQSGNMSEAIATAERLRTQGIPAELDLESLTDEAAARHAKRRGISTIMRVGSDGTIKERDA